MVGVSVRPFIQCGLLVPCPSYYQHYFPSPLLHPDAPILTIKPCNLSATTAPLSKSLLPASATPPLHFQFTFAGTLPPAGPHPPGVLLPPRSVTAPCGPSSRTQLRLCSPSNPPADTPSSLPSSLPVLTLGCALHAMPPRMNVTLAKGTSLSTHLPLDAGPQTSGARQSL